MAFLHVCTYRSMDALIKLNYLSCRNIETMSILDIMKFRKFGRGNRHIGKMEKDGLNLEIIYDGDLLPIFFKFYNTL